MNTRDHTIAALEENTMNNQLIKLVIGDWSDEGHGRTDTIFVQANRSAIEIEDAHGRACRKYKIPSFCDDYEDSTISEVLWFQLTELGAIPPDWVWDPEAEFTNYLSSDAFAEIYINIAKLGDPGLEVEVLNPSSIHAGGYGLY